MILNKINLLMLLIVGVIISINQIYGSENLDKRKAKFSFDVYEIIRERFCNETCNIPMGRNRTSRTIILCLIKCGKFDNSLTTASKSTAITSNISTITPQSTASSVITLPVTSPSFFPNISPGNFNNGQASRRQINNPVKFQSIPSTISELSIDDAIKKYFNNNPISLSVLNISVPLSLDGIVFGKADKI